MSFRGQPPSAHITNAVITPGVAGGKAVLLSDSTHLDVLQATTRNGQCTVEGVDKIGLSSEQIPFSASLSNDGRFILLGGRSCAEIYDAWLEYKSVARFSPPFHIKCADICRLWNGTYLVALGGSGGLEVHLFYLCGLDYKIRILHHFEELESRPVCSVKFSFRGDYVAMATLEGMLAIISIQPIPECSPQALPSRVDVSWEYCEIVESHVIDRVTCLSFSGSGEMLAVGGWNGVVDMYYKEESWRRLVDFIAKEDCVDLLAPLGCSIPWTGVNANEGPGSMVVWSPNELYFVAIFFVSSESQHFHKGSHVRLYRFNPVAARSGLGAAFVEDANLISNERDTEKIIRGAGTCSVHGILLYCADGSVELVEWPKYCVVAAPNNSDIHCAPESASTTIIGSVVGNECSAKLSLSTTGTLLDDMEAANAMSTYEPLSVCPERMISVHWTVNVEKESTEILYLPHLPTSLLGVSDFPTKKGLQMWRMSVTKEYVAVGAGLFLTVSSRGQCRWEVIRSTAFVQNFDFCGDNYLAVLDGNGFFAFHCLRTFRQIASQQLDTSISSLACVAIVGGSDERVWAIFERERGRDSSRKNPILELTFSTDGTVRTLICKHLLPQSFNSISIDEKASTLVVKMDGDDYEGEITREYQLP